MEINTLLAIILTSLYDLINGLISAVAAFLPQFSVSQWVQSSMTALSPYLAAVNYFVPISTMATIGLAWVAVVLVWYVVQFVLRFVQLGA